MPATEYFRRDGQPLSREQALDRNGCIKDEVVARTRMTMRDSASRFTDGRQFWDANRASLLVTDAAALGGTKGNQPGFRVLDSAVNAQDRADAYRAYEDDLTNAWRTPPPPTGSASSGRDAVSGAPPGAYPYTAAAEGAACTIDGRPGRLVKQGNALVCEPTTTDARTSDGMTCPDCGGNGIQAGHACPTCGGTGEIDFDEDEEETAEASRADATTTRSDRALNLDQLRASHQRNMNRLYADHERELCEAWRQGK